MYQYKKILIAGALTVVLSLGSAPALANVNPEHLQLIINNQLYTQEEMLAQTQESARLINGRVYVPLRFVGESLGRDVNWVEHKRWVVINEPGVQTAVYDDGVWVAEDAPISIYIDGVEVESDEATGMPFLSESGRSMVPLRLVSEHMDCEVQWLDGVVIVAERDVEREEDVKADSNESDEENNDADVVTGWHALSIQGESIATARELNAFLAQKEPAIRKMMETQYPELGFTPFPDNIAELYLEIGEKYHIRGDLAFAQALKETGYFQFYGSVKPFQNNFCGLGASGIENTGEEALNGVDPDRAMYIPGLHGLTFTNVADGVEAHMQHLYAYATDRDLPAGCELIDPRFKYVKRGVAKRWIDLNGRWAVPGNGYGESIIDDYWMPAVEDCLPEQL